MEMINTVRKNFWFLLFAPLIGVILGSYLSTLNLHTRVSFWWRPVVQMTGEVTAGPADNYVIVHMHGRKLRGEECKYVGLQAFGDRVVGPQVDLQIARTDIPESGNTRPAGDYDMGFWRIWPVDGVQAVRVFVTHDCNGKMWATKIMEVEL